MLIVLLQPPPIKSWALPDWPPQSLFNWPPPIKLHFIELVFLVPAPIVVKVPVFECEEPIVAFELTVKVVPSKVKLA